MASAAAKPRGAGRGAAQEAPWPRRRAGELAGELGSYTEFVLAVLVIYVLPFLCLNALSLLSLFLFLLPLVTLLSSLLHR